MGFRHTQRRGAFDRFGILKTPAIAMGLIALIVGSGAMNGLGETQLVSSSTTVFVDQNFNSNSAGTGWTLPNNPAFIGSQNGACLTEGGSPSSASLIPQCPGASNTNDSGSLRLTNNGDFQLGTVFYSSSVPTSEGLVAKFNTYQYNNQGGAGPADGIGFVLAAANPGDPKPPATGGSPGGALGYGTYPAGVIGSGRSVEPGIPNGYLGLGLDVYGNYLNPQYAGSGCTSLSNYGYQTTYPQAITVKGPGNGTNGYCPIKTSGELAGGESLDQPTATARPSAGVPVEIAINPSKNAIQVTGIKGNPHSVSADKYFVEVYPYAQSGNPTATPVLLEGSLPTYTVVGGSGSQSELCLASDTSVCLPTSWVDSATGLPYQLTFGWTASTGQGNEYHEISDVKVNSVTPAPVLGLGISNTATNGDVPTGGNTSFVFSPSVAVTSGAQESYAPTLAATFPVGVTPIYSNISTAAWNCSASHGQDLSCSYTGGVSASHPITSSETLPTITVPVTLSSQVTIGSSLTVHGTLSSQDALPVNASSAVTAVVPTPATTPTAATPATPSLSLTKTDAPGSPNPITRAGQSITYDFGVTNTGNTTLNHLAITDTQSVAGETLSSPASCPVTSLAAGASVTCTGSYTVTSTDIANGKVTDTATATATTTTGAGVTSNPATLTIPVVVPTTAPSTVTPTTKPSSVTPTTKPSSVTPTPVRLVTGPPAPPSSTSSALPIGLAIAGLGLGGLGYVVIERKRHNANGHNNEVA